MPAASGTPVVGKMSSRVMNMKFMQRKSNTGETTDTKENSENTEDEKLHIKDTSEWSFGARGKNSILATIRSKKLKSSNNKTPITLSQTVLNKKIHSQEASKDNLLIGKQKLGIKDELEKELEKAVEEEPKEKDLETLFKESNEMNKKSKKRKNKDDIDSDYSASKKTKLTE